MACRRKKIYVGAEPRRYVWCRVYDTLGEMREALGPGEEDTLGVHKALEVLEFPGDDADPTLSEHSGDVLLSREALGPWVVAHEFMHAAIWAHRHGREKAQYPVCLGSMAEEESVLRGMTNAVASFYRWRASLGETIAVTP